MYKIKFYFIFIIFFTATSIFSQVTEEWVKRYNGPRGIDLTQAVTTDNIGNVYVTGVSYSLPPGTGATFITIKYNSAGQQLWVAQYDNNLINPSYLKFIKADNNGNVYVSGDIKTQGSQNVNFIVIKYNSNGVQQWMSQYNGTAGSGEDYVYAMEIDNSGNVYVTGESIGLSNYDYCTVKYNISGIQQWVARYDGGNTDRALALTIDNNGNVYVTGQSSNGQNYDYATVKYNSLGDSIWVRKFNGTGNDYSRSIALDLAGNVYVTGSSWGNGNNADYATIKYNSNGFQQWIAWYQGPDNNGNDDPSSVLADPYGKIVVSGLSKGNGTNDDFATVKYDSSGIQEWESRYDGPIHGNENVHSMKIDNFGNVYITGESQGLNHEDYATIKYNSSGVLKWLVRYNGPGLNSDIALSLALDTNKNVFVTGVSKGVGTENEICTIKYSQPDGINLTSGIIPDRFELYQNYPNPFNPVTKIKFDLRNSDLVKIRVYDISGKEVSILINHKLDAGTYLVDFDGSELTSGIYFYQIISGDYIVAKKMILNK